MTRERIVWTASTLIRERGIAETSLDDLIDRAEVSKSQLYHYFEDRSDLLRAVIEHNTEFVLGATGPLDGWKAIRSWFDSLVDLQVKRRALGGCPVGALVGQLAENDEQARLALAASFARWEARLRDGLRSMRARGKLQRSADPDRLATATLAAIQGGLILTQARRDPDQLAIALDTAYAYLRTFANDVGYRGVARRPTLPRTAVARPRAAPSEITSTALGAARGHFSGWVSLSLSCTSCP